MARFLLPTLVLGGFLVLPAPAVRAADAEPPKGAPPQLAEFLKASPEEIIKRFDKNNDGLLSPDEAPPFLKRFFERADRNGDGRLDKDEVAGVQRVLRQRFGGPAGGRGTGSEERPAGQVPDFDALDRDADGRLTRDELKGTPHAERFDQIDANKDGKIDRKEWAAYFQTKGR
jgi:Ca2+-binding EF-hand superfamily protein